MDTIKVIQLVTIKQNLDNIFSQKMNPTFAFKFLKLLKQIQNEYDNISQIQKKITEDFDGNKQEEFERFLRMTDIDISNFSKIKQSDIIESNIHISAIDLQALQFLIEDNYCLFKYLILILCY